jgi:hypothetical protein
MAQDPPRRGWAGSARPGPGTARTRRRYRRRRGPVVGGNRADRAAAVLCRPRGRLGGSGPTPPRASARAEPAAALRSTAPASTAPVASDSATSSRPRSARVRWGSWPGSSRDRSSVLRRRCAALIRVAGTQLLNTTDVLDDRPHLGSALGEVVLLPIATNLPEIAVTVAASASVRGSLDPRWFTVPGPWFGRGCAGLVQRGPSRGRRVCGCRGVRRRVRRLQAVRRGWRVRAEFRR